MYFIGSILALVGAIWMTVNAAKKDGALAAILCFICTFYTIYYGIKNFAENKIPLILLIVGVAIAVIFNPGMSAMSAAAPVTGG